MKKRFLLLLIVLLVSSSVEAQIEYSYDYKYVTLNPNYGYLNRDNFNERYGSDLRTMLNALGSQGYHLIPNSTGEGGVFLFERQNRVDGKTVNDAIAAFRNEIMARIDSIAEQKANSASAKLKMELVDAMKDAKLYDDEYKKAIIDAAVAKFKDEMKKSVSDIKNETSRTTVNSTKKNK